MTVNLLTNLAAIILFSIGALCFLVQAFRIYWFKKNAIKIKAIIIARYADPNAYAKRFTASDNFYIEYEYIVAGQKFTNKVQNYNRSDFEKYKSNDEIEIIYNAKNPKKSNLLNKTDNLFAVMIMFFLGCMFVVLRLSGIA